MNHYSPQVQLFSKSCLDGMESLVHPSLRSAFFPAIKRTFKDAAEIVREWISSVALIGPRIHQMQLSRLRNVQDGLREIPGVNSYLAANRVRGHSLQQAPALPLLVDQ